MSYDYFANFIINKYVPVLLKKANYIYPLSGWLKQMQQFLEEISEDVDVYNICFLPTRLANPKT
jgi:hypothetical protein